MDAQEKQEIETKQYRADMRRVTAELVRNQKCLHDSFLAYKVDDEAWKQRFQPYLEAEIQSQTEWRALIRDKKKQLISRAIDGTFLAVVALLVYNAGAKLKAWLGALT